MFKIKIEDYGYDCEGVGRNNGKVCFVPYTVKGEIVEVEEIEKDKTFSKCKLLSVENKSEKRVNPLCPYYGICGGCALQHVDYQTELDIKKEVLSKQLAKAGYKGEIKVVKSDNDYFYRNKIKLFPSEEGLGLKKLASNDVVPISECKIVQKSINQAIEKVQTFVKAQNLLPIIKEVQIKCEKDFCLVWFILTQKADVSFQGLQIMLGAGSGVFWSMPHHSPQKILGDYCLVRVDSGLKYCFNVESFRQVNSQVADMMYQEVIKNLKIGDVINAYSGAGLLTGMISKTHRCYGIELGLAEHKDAEKLKEQNSLGKMFNFLGDVAVVLPKILSNHIKTIVLDPPRKGCDKKVCSVLNQSGVDRIIYISCDSATLSRDLQRMPQYKISKAIMFDMFCKTANMETLVVLDKKSKKNLSTKN